MAIVALYNEVDAFAAQWTRNAMQAGLIANGSVDERSIKELSPADVAGPGQRHFFAGIGTWSTALRLAGIPDDSDVWTGSCPCQGFSSAGKRRGFDDPRHLWPVWFELIRACRPPVLFGEQVASALGWEWLDLVFADLESEGYSCAAADLPACSVGAPHRRQRLFFVAYANREHGRLLAAQRQPRRADPEVERGREVGDMAHTDGERLGPRRTSETLRDGAHESAGLRDAGIVGDTNGSRHDRCQDARADRGDAHPCAPENERGPAGYFESERASSARELGDPGITRSQIRRVPWSAVPPGATRGFWTDAAWLLCRDGKARPVEPGACPLVDGTHARVGRLRAHGNQIVPQVAAAFVTAALEAA